MRIADIVTTRFPMIANDKELQYRDWVIPQGVSTLTHSAPGRFLADRREHKTSISMTYCKAALDPEIFPDPHTFNPDRWLEPGIDSAHLEKFVLPFGRGSRMCIGMQ